MADRGAESGCFMHQGSVAPRRGAGCSFVLGVTAIAPRWVPVRVPPGFPIATCQPGCTSPGRLNAAGVAIFNTGMGETLTK